MNVENSRSSRVLPTPGSPTTVTSCGEPARASWSRYCSILRKTCRRVADSSARPTNVVRCCSRRSIPIRLRARSGRQIASGSALPFTVTGGSSSYSNTPAVAWCAASPTTIVPVGATFCSRDAVLTTSPVTLSPICGPWPNAITASPELIPIRTASSRPGCSPFASWTTSRICRPARIARSGSSSCPIGRAEHAEHRVADELVHRAAEMLDRAFQQRVIDAEHRLDVLGVRLVRAFREPDEVAEQDGDDLALLAQGHARER